MEGPILIVEDDPNTAALVRTYLEREGFATIHAADGLTGLQLARDRQPVFVILDIMLPRLDGWEVCRRLAVVGLPRAMRMLTWAHDADGLKNRDVRPAFCRSARVAGCEDGAGR